MQVSSYTPDAAARSLQNRRVLLAPICLCLVAGLHVWRVTTAGQTPWKGGGFGMFSTIDSESSRFVRATLLTSEGPRPIVIPSEFEKKIAELRAAPNQAQLQDLADRLAARGWIDPLAAQQWLAEQLRQEATAPLTAKRLRELRTVRPVNTITSPANTKLVAAKKNETAGEPIPFTAVRVELYKFEMPAGTADLRSRLLLEAVSAAGEQP